MNYTEARRAGLAFYVQRGSYDTYCPTPIVKSPGWRFGDCGSFYSYLDAVRACTVLNDKAKAMDS